MKTVTRLLFSAVLLIGAVGCSDEKRGMVMAEDFSLTLIEWAGKSDKALNEVEAEELGLIKEYIEVYLRIDQGGTATHLGVRTKGRSLLGARIQISEGGGTALVPFGDSLGDFYPNTIRVIELKGGSKISDRKSLRVSKVGGLLK